MEKPYHIVGKDDTQGLASFLAKNGQALLPMMELIEQSQVALDEVIDVAGRAMIEALLRLSAEGMAGPPHPGKKGGAIGWHGREQGTVCLKERKLRVKRPRLRRGRRKGARFRFRPTKRCRRTGSWGAGCWKFCCEESRLDNTRRCCRRWQRRWACRGRA